MCTVVYTVKCAHCGQYKSIQIPVKTHEFSNLEDDFGCLFFYIDIYSMGNSKRKDGQTQKAKGCKSAANEHRIILIPIYRGMIKMRSHLLLYCHNRRNPENNIYLYKRENRSFYCNTTTRILLIYFPN